MLYAVPNSILWHKSIAYVSCLVSCTLVSEDKRKVTCYMLYLTAFFHTSLYVSCLVSCTLVSEDKRKVTCYMLYLTAFFHTSLYVSCLVSCTLVRKVTCYIWSCMYYISALCILTLVFSMTRWTQYCSKSISQPNVTADYIYISG